MTHDSAQASPRAGWLRISVSGLFLTCLTILVAAALSSTGQRILGIVRPLREELLQGLEWRDSIAGGDLRQASRALEHKSALLNRLLMPRLPDMGKARYEEQPAKGAGLWAGDGSGALVEINRALDSKARLMAKFRREAAKGASDFQELSQMQSQSLAAAPSMAQTSQSTIEGSAQSATSDAAGPLERKKSILNDILDDAASDLGPEESDSYHAPETADLQDKIADIKGLAKKQHVPLPPLAPDSDVVQGARGLFAARIEGKVVNVVDGSPIMGKSTPTVGESMHTHTIEDPPTPRCLRSFPCYTRIAYDQRRMTVALFAEGATVELVGPNKPLPPKMIQSVAKDGPLHPEVDKILNFLARGFAVIGLRNKRKGSDPSLGAYETETDDNGGFKLAAAPGIYSVRTPPGLTLCFAFILATW